MAARSFLSIAMVVSVLMPGGFLFRQGRAVAQQVGAQQVSRAELEKLRIGRIETVGNVTVGRAQVLAVVRARNGELFDAESVGEDVKRIAGIKGVEYAYYNTVVEEGQVKLTFVVVERNLVRSIAFNGSKKFSVGKLAGELGFSKGDYLDVFLANNAVEAIMEQYRKKGFAFAEVKLDETKLPLGNVEYTINEGPCVKVRKVVFKGNKTLSARALKKVIKTKTRRMLLMSADYNREKVDQDVVRLQTAYQKKAFLDARITAETEFTRDKKGATVTFNIDEGSVYLVNKVTISGNTFFDEEQLSQGIKLKSGGYYTGGRADYDARHIRSRYLEQGFIDAVVEHRRTFAGTSKIDVEFTVAQGRRFRIGRVDIIGNQATKDTAIRRVLDEEGFTPGAWYDAETARGDGTGELEMVVRRTTVNESTKITPLTAKEGSDARDVSVGIIEGQTGSIMFGAGVASDIGVVGNIVYDQRNFDISDWPESLADAIYGRSFKGAGQKFRASFSPGTVQSTFSVNFTEPYLYDKPVSLNTSISGFDRWRDAYDENRVKGYVGIEKRYEDRWRRGIAFRAESVEITDIDYDAPKEIKDADGDNVLFGVKLFIRKDSTDSRYLPSSGQNFTASFEQVGGDYTFGVLSSTQRWYRTLHEDLADRKTILEVKLHSATVVGDAPIFEKFYAGGTGRDSLRGFDYRGVSTRGLQTGGVPNPQRLEEIGSDWIVLGNAEIAVPLDSEVLSMLFFMDAGMIDSGGVRASIGTGIQILLPQWFGPVPMRLEVAVPFLKEDDDETRSFSFSVGALF